MNLRRDIDVIGHNACDTHTGARAHTPSDLSFARGPVAPKATPNVPSRQTKIVTSLRQQPNQLLLTDLRRAFGSLEQRICQLALSTVQLDDALFNRARRDQSIHGYRSLLANSMRAIRCLLFSRRIPPGIQMDDVIGSREVQAEAARFQADEE